MALRGTAAAAAPPPLEMLVGGRSGRLAPLDSNPHCPSRHIIFRLSIPFATKLWEKAGRSAGNQRSRSAGLVRRHVFASLSPQFHANTLLEALSGAPVSADALSLSLVRRTSV